MKKQDLYPVGSQAVIVCQAISIKEADGLLNYILFQQIC